MANYSGLNYFDAKYFGNCLSTAIGQTGMDMSAAAFANKYFGSGKSMQQRVYRWINGECFPNHEHMQKLIDIFGWKTVRGWMRFTFDLRAADPWGTDAYIAQPWV